MGTQDKCLRNRHCRPDTKRPCFVRAGRDNTPAFALFWICTYYHRFSRKAGLVPDFYGGVKTVHIQVQDNPLPGVMRNHFLKDGVPEIYYFGGQDESDSVPVVKSTAASRFTV